MNTGNVEMKGFAHFLKEKELSNEKYRLLAQLAMTIMSPLDFMEQYPKLHKKNKPDGCDFNRLDAIETTGSEIGFISNMAPSIDLYQVQLVGSPANHSFTSSDLKHYFDSDKVVADFMKIFYSRDLSL